MSLPSRYSGTPPGNSMTPCSRLELPMFHSAPPGCDSAPILREVSAFSSLLNATAVKALDSAIETLPAQASGIDRRPMTRPKRSTTIMCIRQVCGVPAASTRNSDCSVFAAASAWSRICCTSTSISCGSAKTSYPSCTRPPELWQPPIASPNIKAVQSIVPLIIRS